MYCRKCGTKIEDDSLFCLRCGTKVLEYAHKKNSPTSEEIKNEKHNPKDNTQKGTLVVETNKIRHPRLKKPLVLIMFIGMFIYILTGIYLRYGAAINLGQLLNSLYERFSLNLIASPLGFFYYLRDAVISIFSAFAFLIFIYFIANTFIFWGAAAGISSKKASFWVSLLAQLVIIIAFILITLIFSLLPVIGTFMGLLASFLLIPLILKGIYNTSYGAGFGIIIVSTLTIAASFMLSNLFFILDSPF